ncbi:MAG: hypothetical protein R6X12_05360 [bacterium]
MVRSRAAAGRNVFAEIEAGRIGTAWLLVGDNTLLVDEIIARLRAKVVDPDFEAFDYESWLADEVSPEAFEQAIRQMPAGSPRRMVVVKGITRPGSRGPAYARQLGAHGVERMLAALAAVPDSACVVLTGTPKREFARLAGSLGLAGAIVPVEQPDAESLAGFARAWARERGLELEPGAARLLVEVVGADAAIVRSEVDKLAAAHPTGTKLGPAEVRSLAGASREFTLAEYVGRFLRRDAAGALEVLRRLEAWSNPREIAGGVVAWLTNALVDLAAERAGALAPNLRWRVRDHSRHWPSLAELNRVLQALYRLNRDSVSGRPETLARIEALTTCAACRRDAGYCDAFAFAPPGPGAELCIVPGRTRRSQDG